MLKVKEFEIETMQFSLKTIFAILIKFLKDSSGALFGNVRPGVH